MPTRLARNARTRSTTETKRRGLTSRPPRRPVGPRGPARLARPRGAQVAMIAVMVLAGWLRLHGVNWDEGHHLHPDERFLSSVTNDIKWTGDLRSYFDPATSPLSPYALPNMGLFVYGTLPVYIVKGMAVLVDRNNYDQITILGRALSALFDLGTILVLYLIGRELYNKRIAVTAALLLALSVLNIQLSHFYAVDTFANLFVVSTMYFMIKASRNGSWSDYALTGVMLGLGMASKLSVLTLVVPILVGAGYDLYRRRRAHGGEGTLEQVAVRLLTLAMLAALTFRVLQPIAFSGPTFSDWSLNSRWVRDVVDQQKTVTGEADPPWTQQWTGRSPLYPLYNILVWGLGLPLGLCALAGLGLAILELARHRRFEHLLVVVYVISTFIYHAATFVKFMRYFLPIYPFLALLAANMLSWLWDQSQQEVQRPRSAAKPKSWAQQLRIFPLTRGVRGWAALAAAGFVLVGTLLYALAFSGIYGRMHTRVAASRWMYANVPAGSTLANEHWDDWLPIGGIDGLTAYGDQGRFQAVQMVNYEDDTPAKLDQMIASLEAADFVVLSSNRLYDSIPRLPMRYPMTTRYYQLLFDGQLGFQRVAEFTSYPTLLGISLPDQAAEESFSVYDHPRVQIFQKTGAFNAAQARQRLSEGIVWSDVLRLTPRQASAAPNGLRLSAGELELYQKASLWTSAAIRAQSLGSRLPVLGWFLAVQVIGLLTLPLTALAFRGLHDRGYVLSKAVGLLLVAWGAWLLASLRIAPFTWWTVVAVLAALTVLSAVLLWRWTWGDLREFLISRWKLIALEEVVFWACFGLLLLVRWNNPDLWHPGTGGEKPMDLAYLTAIVRTPYFPPYDPWFSGGYINYYYFGFVLVAALIHLTSIVPTTAYNLAVPLFFAMTASGGFVVALNLAEGWSGKRRGREPGGLGVTRAVLLAGIAGAMFVAIIGNLAQVQLLWNGVRNLSGLGGEVRAAPLGVVAEIGNGLKKWAGGERLPLNTDWWYWNATRVIPPGEGEPGPINEFPYFTFLFGDLHAHMMALPYTVVALACITAILRDSPAPRSPGRGRGRRIDHQELMMLGILALTTGALWPMNTWDFPTYTALVALALALREFARRGRVEAAGFWQAGWRLAVVVSVGRFMFLPFHQAYASAYFGAEWWKGSHTGLGPYLLMHGFFLLVLGSYLISEMLQGSGHNALIRSLRLDLKYWRHPLRLKEWRERLVRPTVGFRDWRRGARFVLLLLAVAVIAWPVVGLASCLTLLAALLFFGKRPRPLRQLCLAMIGLAFALTVVVEIVVLKGDIGRMNTVFKFYLQVWVLWALSSAAVLPILARRLRGRVPEIARLRGSRAERPPDRRRLSAGEETATASGSPVWARRWWSAFGLLLAACLLYPLTATPVRARDRFENSRVQTLDGTTFMRTATYYDEGRPVELEWDRQAVEWLCSNVSGIPTVLEANTPLYRWGSRVSIYTGLPAIIGWDWHQKQQRSVVPGPVVDRRLEDVRTIYTTQDVAEALQLVRRYGVTYIYVGPLERLYYPAEGLAKFDQPSALWTVVYQNPQVRILQVR